MPQADQKVQYKVDHCVKYRGHFEDLSRIFGVGQREEGKDGPVDDGDSSQLGGTGGEGPLAEWMSSTVTKINMYEARMMSSVLTSLKVAKQRG